MSGGSLNYLANTMCETLFNDETDVNYDKICDKDNARFARKMNPMHDRELSELMADVICLLHTLEWCESCDIGEETYEECVKKFKAKWMHRTEKDRLNSYLDDLKSYYEELAEELKGTEKC